MTLPEKATVSMTIHASANHRELDRFDSCRCRQADAGARSNRCLRSQKDVGLLFGDAAIRLGFVRPQDVEQALARQFEYPYLVPGQNKISRDVVAAYNPFSAEVDFCVRPGVSSLRGGLVRTSIAAPLRLPAHPEATVAATSRLTWLSVFSNSGSARFSSMPDMRESAQHLLFGVANASRAVVSPFRASWSGCNIKDSGFAWLVRCSRLVRLHQTREIWLRGCPSRPRWSSPSRPMML